MDGYCKELAFVGDKKNWRRHLRRPNFIESGLVRDGIRGFQFRLRVKEEPRTFFVVEGESSKSIKNRGKLYGRLC